jgi:Ser/Thr protein kinase RdoA (MazF antagonist)
MNSAFLADLANRFAIEGVTCAVEPLGRGNVNDTYRVETSSGTRYVLQRLNTAVFPNPDRVMDNLHKLTHHCQGKTRPHGWRLPEPVPTRCDAGWLHQDSEGSFWRLLTHIDGATSVDVLSSPEQAAEIGRALGRFHALVHDLPTADLADTLEGFHVTPLYYERYRRQLDVLALSAAAPYPESAEQEAWCMDFIARRQTLVPVLEQAKEAGRLQLRPIHGDPKVNNVMLCSTTGCCVAMVDLDTVKPGLLHYDIGDALRSGCNPAGEEAIELDAVRFDLDLAGAMLSGYLKEAGSVLTTDDIAHLYDALRLLPFELGLRFFTDYLAGDVYFKVNRPRHNLERAMVQFRLTASVEEQEASIRALIDQLCR